MTRQAGGSYKLNMKSWRGTLMVVLIAGAVAATLLWRDWRTGPAARSERLEVAAEVTLEQTGPSGICRDIVFEGARSILCTIDPASQVVRLAYRDRAGAPYGSVEKAAAVLDGGNEAGDRLALVMNAGMYHADLAPVGLYVENGVEIAPLTNDEGFGNFFLKPNGVFFVGGDGRAGVMETLAYQAAGIDPAFATQSGPMLVTGGDIHPRFLPDGTSKHIRNGVGVRADGEIVLAITRDPVSLGAFARLFRDAADCPDALFFDGAVSSLALGTQMEIDAGEPAGPVIAVFHRSDGPSS